MYKRIVIGKYINYVIILGLFFFSLFFFKQPALAAEQTEILPKQNLSVSPIIENVQLTPGKQTQYILYISNLADKPMGIHIDISGFDPQDDSPNQNLLNSLSKWTSISQTDSIVDAKQTDTFTVTISPPPGLRDGGYYATLTITPFISQQQNSKEPIVLTRFISLIFGTVGSPNYDDLGKKVHIENFSSHLDLIQHSQKLSIDFAVSNSYFTHFTAKPFLTISPLFGNSQTFLLEEKHIFPGRSRTWEIPFPVPTNRIFYHMYLAVSVGDGKQVLADAFVILLPDTITIIAGILLLFVVGLLLRKRLRRVIKIIVKGY